MTVKDFSRFIRFRSLSASSEELAGFSDADGKQFSDYPVEDLGDGTMVSPYAIIVKVSDSGEIIEPVTFPIGNLGVADDIATYMNLAYQIAVEDVTR